MKCSNINVSSTTRHIKGTDNAEIKVKNTGNTEITKVKLEIDPSSPLGTENCRRKLVRY